MEKTGTTFTINCLPVYNEEGKLVSPDLDNDQNDLYRKRFCNLPFNYITNDSGKIDIKKLVSYCNTEVSTVIKHVKVQRHYSEVRKKFDSSLIEAYIKPFMSENLSLQQIDKWKDIEFLDISWMDKYFSYFKLLYLSPDVIYLLLTKWGAKFEIGCHNDVVSDISLTHLLWDRFSANKELTEAETNLFYFLCTIYAQLYRPDVNK